MSQDVEGNSQRPVLEYGTAGLDRCPDWNGVAESRIDLGAGPSALHRDFANRQLAVSYYAKSMARRHSLETIGVNCAHCGAYGVEFAAKAECLAQTPRPWFYPGWMSNYRATFVVHHAICRPCFRHWRVRVRKFLLGVIAVMASILILSIAIAVTNGARAGSIIGVLVFLITLMLIASGFVFQQLWNEWPKYVKLQLPASVQHTGEVRLLRRPDLPMRVIPEGK